MESREKKILQNSLIFTVGNLGSKVFSYVMVLLYTYYISAAELGYYDIVLTTVSLLQPVVMLSFDEGIYRWLIDASESKIKQILSTSLKTVSALTVIAVVIFECFNIKFHFQYAVEIVLLFVSAIIYQVILNAIRGLANNKLYAISGVLNSFLLFIFEAIAIMGFGMGVEALLLSTFAANILTILFIYIKEPKFHGVLKESYDRKLVEDITKYTVPLIPNSISWWIVNSSDRYIILAYLGTALNGIYSVACKFPTVISTISNILYFALQEAIIKEYNSEDRDAFYSSIFEKYYIFLFSLTLCGIPATKIVIMNFVGNEYIVAGQYIGFLFFSTVFSALSSFLGIGYQISRETIKSSYTTIGAAFINIVTNIVLIKFIGLHAATFSTFIAYFVLFIIRMVHCKKYFTLKVEWLKFYGIFIFAIVYVIASYVGNTIMNILLFCGGLLFLIIANRNAIREFLKNK